LSTENDAIKNAGDTTTNIQLGRCYRGTKGIGKTNGIALLNCYGKAQI